MTWWQRMKSEAPTAGPSGSEVRFGRVLEGLVGRLQRLGHPCLLDLGYTCGSNIDYFIRLGCKVHVDDYTATLLSRPRPVPPPDGGGGKARRSSPGPTKGKVAKVPPPAIPPVEHATAAFQAVLCWDLFDYLAAAEAQAVAAEIHRVTAPGGYVLALFGPARAVAARPPRRFRIRAPGRVEPEDVDGPRLLSHHFPNRDILRLFPEFDIAQTVLLKNGIREMLLQKRNTLERRLSEPQMVPLI
jgi:hypothetical protein